jgi:hypothetical protein
VESVASHYTASGVRITSFIDGDWADIPFGLQQASIDLGPDDGPDHPVLVMTRFPPNVDLPRHSHRAPFCDAVVDGSMWVEDDQTWYPIGTVRSVPGGTVYGPTRSGPDGLTLLEFYASAGGFPADLDLDALTEAQRAELAGWRPET